MKAVLILLAAVVLLGIFTPPTLAELELSIDYFWGDGDTTDKPGEPEHRLGINAVISTPMPEPTPTPIDDPEPTNNPESRPSPNPNTPPKQRSDLKGIIFGLRYPIGRFRPAIELGSGSEKGDSWREDLELLEMKVGYALNEGAQGRIEPYLSYLTLETAEIDASGPILGLDFRYPLTSRISLDGGAGFSFNPRLKNGSSSYRDESLTLVKLKLIYHLNVRWDLGLGYRAYHLNGDTSDSPVSKIDTEYELVTLGFAVKLGARPQTGPPTPGPDIPPEPKTPPPQPEPELGPELQTEPIPEPEPEPPAEPLPIIPFVKENRLLKPIFFDFDKSTFRDDQLPRLDWNIAILKDHPDLYILVAGHADHHGSIDYNIALSRRRAQAVADYLTANGIDLKRITIYAYGETYPYDKYDTNPDWESDRWVDILVSHLPPSWELGIEKRGVPAELQ